MLGQHAFQSSAALERLPQLRRPPSSGELAPHEAATAPSSAPPSFLPHALRVESVSLSAAELELDLFNAWVGAQLQRRGEDILRIKGILAVRGYECKFVFHGAPCPRPCARLHQPAPLAPRPHQPRSAPPPLPHHYPSAGPRVLSCTSSSRAAVHMIFEGATGSKWPADQPRSSRLVMIGRGLDRRELQRGLSACEVQLCREVAPEAYSEMGR